MYDARQDLSKHAKQEGLIEHFGTVLADNDGKARRNQAETGASKRGLTRSTKTARATMPSAFGRTCGPPFQEMETPDAFA